MTSATVLESTRTFHSDSSSKYFLANDATERHRLLKQHQAIVSFMHDQPIHAPIADAPSKILDLGCGVNASMTLFLAEKFPSATIYGVDLSEIVDVEAPRNVTFIKGNIHSLIGQDPRLEPGSADYIYSRFMAAGVEDWLEHIKSISTLLAPGGFLELHEGIRAIWRDEIDQEISRDWQWMRLIGADAVVWPEGDPTGLQFFQSLMKKAGLADVAGKAYKLSPSDKPEAKLWSQYAAELFPTGWLAPIQRKLPGDANRERRKELEEELFTTLKPKEGVYFPAVAVWGRRAE
ncbi:methyltransferase domain-containing protein [Zymoseptoria brevis]|uniref:Methyltransferase domain-containing protein n=1 Tax=Zymoseptoria brevis TaxID=1047168 RepID=A0A0F4G9I2_9PEZI|nr:methyltransferase domain-containing protein [Zymoseptoria brevis]